jgi:hypothetical protein
MPITSELGEELQRRLPNDFDWSELANGNFEDWLTLRLTDLPFLKGFENKRRRAEAERVIAELAIILDERSAVAGSAGSPKWLLQLIQIWHAERAVVLTFNYDTLLEQGINAARPIAALGPGATDVYADQVVYPAPAAPPAQYAIDTSAHTSNSLQVLKLHGSLNWYWASGDVTGSSLVRVREKRVLGRGRPLTVDRDFGGATTLDRYVIPPVTTKDGYYQASLTTAIWRSAREAISNASAVTFMGYSMPANDRVAVELVREADAPFTVVDISPGEPGLPESLVGRLSQMGNVSGVFQGSTAVEEFVRVKLKETSRSLRYSSALGDDAPASANVVLATPGRHQVLYHCLYEEDGTIKPYQIDPQLARRSSSPLIEIAHGQVPARYQKVSLGDFFNRGKLVEHLLTHGSLEVEVDGEMMVAVGAEAMRVERWSLVRLTAAPL